MMVGALKSPITGQMSPALDALRALGSASPASGSRPNPNRLTEDDKWVLAPPHATPPSEESDLDHVLASLRMAYPSKLPYTQPTGPTLQPKLEQ